ncbi:putative hydrolase YxeP [Corynebacterium felinum]|uniref:Amidohydrolase n=1 Tax=Corynebacterium felinum TaxID=131318 RepID=A0ABU2B897_9CORY|nr:amidohydrolase [Corynebacterium felinum]WJY94202.1 putative hydrolase YxeP [Corynebacterium felinum]
MEFEHHTSNHLRAQADHQPGTQPAARTAPNPAPAVPAPSAAPAPAAHSAAPAATDFSVLVDAWIRDNEEQIYRWRRHFHQHPELSDQEHETTAFIAARLREYGLSPVLFPGTGLMVDIGPNTEHKLAFRADIDALPIHENTGYEFSSVTPGVMHACGHDIHTTVALGLACALAETHAKNPLNMGVRIIFQPAEEVMDSGAPNVIKLGVLEGVTSIFAVHAEPKLRTGTVGVRVGPITSAGDVVEIKVTGPGGHSSRPHLSADVVFALSKIVTDLPGLLSRRVDPRTATVMVFGALHAGSAPNAIPEEGVVRGTIRTADIMVWRGIQQLLEELVAAIVAPTGCGFEVDYVKGVPPVVNDDVCTAVLADAARSVDPQSVVQASQSSGGEDFSWYLEHVPGSMARLGCWDGVSTPSDLHKATMLADEKCIPVGIRLFAGIVQRFHAECGYVFSGEL